MPIRPAVTNRLQKREPRQASAGGSPASPAPREREASADDSGIYKRRLMLRIARMHYLDELTQQEIGARLGLSRQKVARVLARAKELGLVRITISDPVFEGFELETGLAATGLLSEALVVPTPSEPRQLPEALGRAAADYLSSMTLDGKTIAVSSGRTVYQSVRALTDLRPAGATVVSLIGGLLEKSEINPNDIASTLAGRLSARCLYVNALALMDSREVREAILADRQTQHVLSVARSADIALVGIGGMGAHTLLLKSNLADGERIIESIRESGAIGQLIGRYFDSRGEKVETELDFRIIGVDLPELRRIPKVVAVAGGREKVEAIAAAVRGRYCSVLVTDVETARGVLALLPAGPATSLARG